MLEYLRYKLIISVHGLECSHLLIYMHPHSAYRSPSPSKSSAFTPMSWISEKQDEEGSFGHFSSRSRIPLLLEPLSTNTTHMKGLCGTKISGSQRLMSSVERQGRFKNVLRTRWFYASITARGVEENGNLDWTDCCLSRLPTAPHPSSPPIKQTKYPNGKITAVLLPSTRIEKISQTPLPSTQNPPVPTWGWVNEWWDESWFVRLESDEVNEVGIPIEKGYECR